MKNIKILLFIVFVNISFVYSYNQNVINSYEWMKQNGLTKQKSIDSFKPNDAIQLQEFAKFLIVFIETIGLNQSNLQNNCNYQDIKEADETLQPYIVKMCKLGLFKKTSGKIQPLSKISKADVVSMIVVLLYGKQNEKASPWYKLYYQKAKQVGIVNDSNINGYANSITKGEVANLLKNSYDIYKTNNLNILYTDFDKYKNAIITYFKDSTYLVKPILNENKFPIEIEKSINYQNIVNKYKLSKDLINSLKQYGFVLISDSINNSKFNMIDYYEYFNTNSIPIFVTSDSVVYVNDLMLKKLQYDLENSILYDYLWKISNELYKNNKLYYNSMTGDIKIASYNNMITFATILEIMKPKTNQFCLQKYEELCDKNVFSDLDGQKYSYETDGLLKQNVEKELQVFNNKHNFDEYLIKNNHFGSHKSLNFYKGLIYLSEYVSFDENTNNITSLQILLNINIISKKEELKKQYSSLNSVITYLYERQNQTGPLELIFILDKLFGNKKYNISRLSNKDNQKLIFNRLTNFKPIFNTSFDCNNTGCFDTNAKLFSMIGSKKSFYELIQTKLSNYKLPIDTLDFASVLGSEYAFSVLGNTITNEYKQEFKILKQSFDSLRPLDFLRTKVGSYLYYIKALLTKNINGYPGFMNSKNWQKKILETVSGYKVVMNYYPKFVDIKDDNKIQQTDILEINDAVSYVEPNPLLYKRMHDGNQMILEALKNFNMLDKSQLQRLQLMSELLQRLTDISIKQLQKQIISKTEYTYIKNIGKVFAKCIDNIDSDLKSTFIIDNGYKDYKTGLHIQGVLGYTKLILVAYYTFDGNLIIGVGPVFDYYETKNAKKQGVNDIKGLKSTNKLTKPKWLDYTK